MNERDLGLTMGMCYGWNIKTKEYPKYQKMLKESRAIGKIIPIAFDKNGKKTNQEMGIYFKNQVEHQKFLQVLNDYINHKEKEFHDLSHITTEELMDELNFRINQNKISRDFKGEIL